MLGVDFIGADFRRLLPLNNNRMTYRLPWAYFIGNYEDGIVMMKTNALMRCYEFGCPDLATASAEAVNRVSLYFNDALRHLGEGWSVNVESRRDLTTEYPGAKWDNKLGYLIDRHRKRNFGRNEHFRNRFFLTLTKALPGEIVSKALGLLYRKDEGAKEGQGYYNWPAMENEIDEFIAQCDEVISYVSANISVKPMNNDECISYLYSSLSVAWEPRIAPVSPTLFDSFLGDKKVDIHQCLKIGDLYVPCITVLDFPTQTRPAMFDSLNAALVEYRWNTRWIGCENQHAKRLLEKYQSKFYGARKSSKTLLFEVVMNTESGKEDPAASEFESDVNAAQVELAHDTVSLGYYTSCIQVWDKDYEVAMEKAKYIATIINACGFGSKIETANAREAWCGMMPGHTSANVRSDLMTSANATHMFPISSVWEGLRENRWMGEVTGCSVPLLICSTPNGVPFYVNMNIGDVGHGIVFGPTGAGKSTFLCFLESQFLKYKNSRVIVLDKDKTARGVTVGAGGVYVEPGASGVAFQPLRNIDEETDLMWACEFIEQCLLQQHIIITADKREVIRDALVQLRDTKSKESRDITLFQQYVTDPEIKQGIQPYTLSGQYGTIFDARDTKIEMSRFVMIEMGTLMKLGDACIIPALMFLFKYIEKQFAEPNDPHGHMTLLVLDEAWVYLDNEYFSSTIEDWLLTLRKKHVFVLFATQEVSKAAGSRIASTIVSQCMTKFYLADRNAESAIVAESYRLFGLDDDEIHALSQARMKRDYMYKSPAGTRMFQLELDRYQLALIGPDTKVLDELEKEYGLNSGKQLAPLILKKQGIEPDDTRAGAA